MVLRDATAPSRLTAQGKGPGLGDRRRRCLEIEGIGDTAPATAAVSLHVPAVLLPRHQGAAGHHMGGAGLLMRIVDDVPQTIRIPADGQGIVVSQDGIPL